MDLNTTDNNNGLTEVTDLKPSKLNEECFELKTIKYKSMILTGKPIPEPKKSSFENMTNLEKYLENEKNSNVLETWSKLDKTTKLKKLLDFAQEYTAENSLTEDDYNSLVAFFRDCLEKKRLNRVKDVIYDKNDGRVVEIPALTFNKTSKNFTLKSAEVKHVGTAKQVPIKKTRTIKHKTTQVSSDSE